MVVGNHASYRILKTRIFNALHHRAWQQLRPADRAKLEDAASEAAAGSRPKAAPL